MSTTAPVKLDDDSNQSVAVLDSRFRLIIVAGLRSKQLLHGSKPKIDADPRKRRNTSIALEEVRLGLVKFRIGSKKNNNTCVGPISTNTQSSV